MQDYEARQRLEDRFDQFLDECYPVYKLGELEFYPSDILKSCDPVAYRVYISDFESEEDEDV